LIYIKVDPDKPKKVAGKKSGADIKSGGNLKKNYLTNNKFIYFPILKYYFHTFIYIAVGFNHFIFF
jgi:hypothetical protein